MTLPPSERERIAERAFKATPTLVEDITSPVPFEVHPGEEPDTWDVVTMHPESAGEVLATCYSPEDASFVGHARSDIPALLKDLAAAELEIERLEKERNEFRDVHLRNLADEIYALRYDLDNSLATVERLEKDRDAAEDHAQAVCVHWATKGVALEAQVARLKDALIHSGAVLEALHSAVEWELAPEIKAEIARVVPIVRRVLLPAPSSPGRERE